MLMKNIFMIFITVLTIFLIGCGSDDDSGSPSSGISIGTGATSDAILTDIKTIAHSQSYAKFYKPEDIVFNNGYAYISDTGNNCIRRISPDGKVIIVIGSTSGEGGDNTDAKTPPKGTSVLMSGPTSLAIATINGDTHLFIADTGNNKILDANITGNPLASTINVKKIAGNKNSGFMDDSNGSNALFFQPHGLHVVANTLYVADTMNHAIRSIALTGGSYATSTLTNSMESTSQPIDLTDDTNGSLLVLLKGANRVDKIPIATPSIVSQLITTDLNAPESLAFDGTNLYVSNTRNHTIVAYDINTSLQSIYAGDKTKKGSFEGTTLLGALFDEPVGLYTTSNELYVVDRGNHKLRKILKTEKLVRTVIGSSEPGLDVTDDDTKQKIEEFYKPEGLVVDPGGKLYFCDTQNQKIRRIDLSSTSKSIISTFIGQQTVGVTQGNTAGTPATTRLHNPTSIVGLWDTNQTFYIIDSYNHSIKKSVGSSTTFFAGSSTKVSGHLDGNGTSALFNRPYAAAADQNGNLYVTDTYNHRIRKITPQGVVTTLAGSIEGFLDGQGNTAKFTYPTGIVFDGASTLYVLDNGNKKIRTVSLSGMVSEVKISNGVSFDNVYGIAIDTGHKTLFVSDVGSNKIWAINLSTKKATSLLNETTAQWVDGNNSNAPFANVRINHPKGLFYEKNSEKIYISDTDNNIIRVMRVAY
jgi:sugar lactone lactonase YvrE